MKSLKQTINEEYINEFTRHEKHRLVKNAIGTFMGKNGGIKNFTILTSENPDSKELSHKENRELFADLKKSLKSGRYVWVEQKGHFRGNDEHSLYILNMPLDSNGYPSVSAYYAGKYEQTSFIYGTVIDGELHSFYYEKKDPTAKYDKAKNPYVLIEETVGVNNASNAEEYSVIGKNFKYTLPLKIFEDVSEQIVQKIKNAVERINEKKGIDMTFDSLMYTVTECVGQVGYLHGVVYGELLDGIQI